MTIERNIMSQKRPPDHRQPPCKNWMIAQKAINPPSSATSQKADISKLWSAQYRILCRSSRSSASSSIPIKRSPPATTEPSCPTYLTPPVIVSGSPPPSPSSRTRAESFLITNKTLARHTVSPAGA